MATTRTPALPPRWFIRGAWVAHRLLYRTTRRGLRRPRPGVMGMLRLRTTGRRSGEERIAIIGYMEHAGAFVTLVMNGWAAADPAWWLNLQAHPDAWADTVDGVVRVRARAALGDERAQLWAAIARLDGWGDIAAAAQLRPHTAVVVLERL